MQEDEPKLSHLLEAPADIGGGAEESKDDILIPLTEAPTSNPPDMTEKPLD